MKSRDQKKPGSSVINPQTRTGTLSLKGKWASKERKRIGKKSGLQVLGYLVTSARIASSGQTLKATDVRNEEDLG